MNTTLFLWTLVGYLVGMPIAWYLAAGLFFSARQGAYPPAALLTRREDAGLAILFGCWCALVWPIGLPAALILTHVGKYGVWRAYGEGAR